MSEYGTYLRHWKKSQGPRPNRELAKVHREKLAKPGSKDAVATAMALRKSGTTMSQVVSVLGKPHRNKIKRLVDSGIAKMIPMSSNGDGHKVYRLKLK